MKEQTGDTEIQINEEETGKLPEKEFRIMIVKTHGQRSLEYYSPLGHKRVGYDLATEQ